MLTYFHNVKVEAFSEVFHLVVLRFRVAVLNLISFPQTVHFDTDREQ